jgi:hypothetical protein
MLSSLGFWNCPIKKGNATIQGCPYGGKPPHTYTLTCMIYFMRHHLNGTSKKLKNKVKFTLEQATNAQRGSRGIFLLFL